MVLRLFRSPRRLLTGVVVMALVAVAGCGGEDSSSPSAAGPLDGLGVVHVSFTTQSVSEPGERSGVEMDVDFDADVANATVERVVDGELTVFEEVQVGSDRFVGVPQARRSMTQGLPWVGGQATRTLSEWLFDAGLDLQARSGDPIEDRPSRINGFDVITYKIDDLDESGSRSQRIRGTASVTDNDLLVQLRVTVTTGYDLADTARNTEQEVRFDLTDVDDVELRTVADDEVFWPPLPCRPDRYLDGDCTSLALYPKAVGELAESLGPGLSGQVAERPEEGWRLSYEVEDDGDLSLDFRILGRIDGGEPVPVAGGSGGAGPIVVVSGTGLSPHAATAYADTPYDVSAAAGREFTYGAVRVETEAILVDLGDGRIVEAEVLGYDPEIGWTFFIHLAEWDLDTIGVHTQSVSYRPLGGDDGDWIRVRRAFDEPR